MEKSFEQCKELSASQWASNLGNVLVLGPIFVLHSGVLSRRCGVGRREAFVAVVAAEPDGDESRMVSCEMSPQGAQVLADDSAAVVGETTDLNCVY